MCMGDLKFQRYMRTEPIAANTLSTSWEEILPPRINRVAITFSVDTAADILIWPIEQPTSTQGILLDNASGGNNVYSFQIQFRGIGANIADGFEINDITIVYREKNIK